MLLLPVISNISALYSDSVKEVPTQKAGIHVFDPSHGVNKTCKTEVSYLPTTAGSEELCFKPG